MRNLWKLPDDPSRCDNQQRGGVARATAVPIITAPVTPTVDPVIKMARRKPTTWNTRRLARSRYTILPTTANTEGARDMTLLQSKWETYLKDVADLANTKFWSVFLALHTESTSAIDSALNSVKKVFVQPSEKKKFPISRRALKHVMGQLHPFWPHVRHTLRIDLTRFRLPSGTKSIVFRFIDPMWGWLVAARRQNPKELHWMPVAQRPGQEVYGGGIQYGKFFVTAHASLPEGAHVLCIGLHWDGTTAHGLTSAPICVCVGNSNSSKSDTQFCIGYSPHVPDERKPEWRNTTQYTEVKFFIRQQCAGAILRVIEEAATRGVKCRLLNSENEDVERLLYARLSSMNFDQPEAQLFFGLQNKCSCSKCRRRIGYSAFRRCNRHVPDEILRLYEQANDNDLSPNARLIAREKLHRWGFNYRRKCCLNEVCRNLLVRIPGRDEVFPSVDFRDRMHGLIIFIHRTLYQFFDESFKSKEHRRVLDRRLHAVGVRRFRINGRVVRKPKTIFGEVGMTAADRVILVFLLSHVVGPGPDDIIDAGIYMPLATAIAQAQLMFIAARGHRCYSVRELDVIFNKGWILFFGSLDAVRSVLYRKRLRTWAQSTHGNPPKRFKRQSRSNISTSINHC